MNIEQSLFLSEPQPEKPLHETKPAVQILASLADNRKGWLSSDQFLLLDVPTHFASTPFPPSNQNAVLAAVRAAAGGYQTDVVIDLNKPQVGRTHKGFMPTVIVMAGQSVVEAARLAGRERVRAWVGQMAAEKLNLIHADHQLGSRELQEKLQEAHNKASGYDPSKPTGPKNQSSYLTETYPLEGYHVFQQGGNNFKQRHSVDLNTRQVKLVGQPQPVKQKWVDMDAAWRSSRKQSRSARPGSAKGPSFPKLGKVPKINLAKDKDMESAHPTRALRPPVQWVRGNSPFPNARKDGMNMEDAVKAFGGGNASGPPYSSGLGTQPAANRTRQVTADVEGQSSPGALGKPIADRGNANTDTPDVEVYHWNRDHSVPEEEHGGASKSEMRQRILQRRRHSIQGSGYFGYPGATATQKAKLKGATGSEMAPKLDDVVSAYEKALAAGAVRVKTIRTKAPPGLENMVQGLKKKYGEKSSVPFQIAWWHHNQGKG